MPWRLIGFIIIFGIFLVFIVFNLGNKCDISFGFRTFPDVPVYLTVFSAFIVGMFSAMPFIISFRAKKKKQHTEKEEPEPKAKKKRGTKGGETSAGPEGGSFSDGGPYGIN
jgi:uncharacterized integral membrane protein